MIDPPAARPPTVPPTYERELAAAIDAARAAGAAIHDVFGQEQAVTYKVGDDPLTAADSAADRCIRDRLRAAFPADGWLSEESDAPAGRRSSAASGSSIRSMGLASSCSTSPSSRSPSPDGRRPTGGGGRLQPHPRPARDAPSRGGGVTIDGRPRRSQRGDGPRDGRRAGQPERGQAWPMVPVRGSLPGRADGQHRLQDGPRRDRRGGRHDQPRTEARLGRLRRRAARRGGRGLGITLLDGSAIDLAQPGALLDGLIADNARLHEQLVAAVADVARRGSCGA